MIRNTNFTKEGALDDSDIAYLDVEARKLDKRRLRLGDIILEKSGGGPKQPVGRVALFDKENGDFSFSNFTAALRVIESSELDFRFLHKFLHWTYLSGATEGMQSHSTGIRNLDGEAYKAIKIAFPSLPEQQRIVRILDEAFEAIATAKANAEKNLENAGAIFESHRQKAFERRDLDWVEKPLGEVAEFKNGLNYNRNSSGQTLFVVGVANFQDNYLVPIDELEEATIDGELSDAYAIRKDDILTVRSNGSKSLVGRCMLVGEVEGADSVSYSGFIIRIRLSDDGVFPRYLLHFMKSAATRGILTNGGGGANITNINQEKLSSLVVPFPSRKTQVKMAHELDQLREETLRLSSLYQQKLSALEALKKSLLHQAFSGAL